MQVSLGVSSSIPAPPPPSLLLSLSTQPVSSVLHLVILWRRVEVVGMSGNSLSGMFLLESDSSMEASVVASTWKENLSLSGLCLTSIVSYRVPHEEMTHMQPTSHCFKCNKCCNKCQVERSLFTYRLPLLEFVHEIIVFLEVEENVRNNSFFDVTNDLLDDFF